MNHSLENQINRLEQLNFAYLQIELGRIDLLIQRAVRTWQIAGQNPADEFRGLYVTIPEAAVLAARPFGSSWGAGISLPEEEQAQFLSEQKSAQAQAAALLQAAAAQQAVPRLAALAEKFQLSTFEYDAFLICLAPCLDVRYDRLYAFLQDDISKKAPCVSLISDLLLPPGLESLGCLEFFQDQAPLLKWGLLKCTPADNGQAQSILRRELTAAPEIIAWLLGNYHPEPGFTGIFELSRPTQTSSLLFDPAQEGSFNWSLIGVSRPMLAFIGADDLRQQAAAQTVAARLSQPLLSIDLHACKAKNLLSTEAVRLALRDARLTGAVPYFSGWEAWIDSDGCIPNPVLEEIAGFEGPVVVSSAAAWRTNQTRFTDQKPILRWFIDVPGYSQRELLWTDYLGENGSLGKQDLDLLAAQFTLTSAPIQAAALSAKHTALQNERPVQVEDLFEAARQQTSHLLDTLAVKIKPRYTWEDIVLPDEDAAILKEIVGTVRERPLVLDTWGLGKKLVASAGLAALFAGPPGTGKTLAAQVIAAELGMDLFKIDLSSVVSKYIGETEKNLERIFSQARNTNAILFFDEADTLFGKRSEVKDAHDRYANIEVGYLLQRIESYDGVVILATNLRSNLDDAFIRRLQFIVDFPFPDEAQRLNIWKVLFPHEAPREKNIDFDLLSRRFKLSGGSIRNAIVSASFLAASENSPISTRHMLHGVRRELQKMGRLIDEKELLEVKP